MAIRATPPSEDHLAMQANRKTLGTRTVAVTLILLAITTVGFALSREDVLMIALGLLLAATSMEWFRR
jgi:purine-cytosine permease-like protein